MRAAFFWQLKQCYKHLKATRKAPPDAISRVISSHRSTIGGTDLREALQDVHARILRDAISKELRVVVLWKIERGNAKRRGLEFAR
jgi:hypothetical protein